jgi:hypothetical protein
VGLKRGPVSLVSTIEELLRRKSRVTGLEIRDYGRRGHATPPYPQKLTLTSPTSCGRSVGIVRSRTKSKIFFLLRFLPRHVYSPIASKAYRWVFHVFLRPAPACLSSSVGTYSITVLSGRSPNIRCTCSFRFWLHFPASWVILSSPSRCAIPSFRL